MTTNHRPTFVRVLEKTTFVIFTRRHILQFLFLSFVLLGVRTIMDYTAHRAFASFIDNYPSIKSLFTRDKSFDSINTQPATFSNASLLVNDRNTEIEHQASTALYSLGSFFVSYGYLLLVYVLSQSIIHGIIFVFVVNLILDNRNSFMNTCRKGVILGLKRLSGLILLKWGLLQLIVQIMFVWFVGIDDNYSDFNILVRLWFLPFSAGFKPIMEGLDKKIYGFLLTYFPFELLILYLYAICVWVAMADSRKTYREVIREGRYMLSLAINPAIYLRWLESYVYLIFPIILQVTGVFVASFFQSFMVIYSMVAWLMYYFSLRAMDANSGGVPFGESECSAMINDS